MKKVNFMQVFALPQSLTATIFQSEHDRFKSLFTEWSINATKRKIIAAYWLKILLNHFCVLVFSGIVIVSLVNPAQVAELNLLLFFPGSIIVFMVLFLAMYWPIYHLEFMPHLEAAIEIYKGNQVEGIQQCKKQQYSVVTLMLIQHVYQELSGLDPVLINAAISQLLGKQYGISVKSIMPALLLIQRGDWNKTSNRKRTETLDDFEAARNYFQNLNCEKAVAVLERLQHKVIRVAC